MQKILLTLLILAGIVSCSDKKDIPVTRDKYYLINSAVSNIPVDLNADGIYNNDLTKELPLNNAFVLVSTRYANPSVKINWPEPLINNTIFLEPLPDTLAQSTKLTYAATDQIYTAKISQVNSSLIKGERVVNDNRVYSFVFPDSLIINGDKIEFISSQSVFITKKEKKAIIIKASFKFDSYLF